MAARNPRLPGIGAGTRASKLKGVLADAGLACPTCGKVEYRLEYDRANQRTGYRICLRDGTRWPVGAAEES